MSPLSLAALSALYISFVVASPTAPPSGLQISNANVPSDKIVPQNFIAVYKQGVNSSTIQAHEARIRASLRKRDTTLAGIKKTYEINSFRGYHIEAEDDVIASIIAAPEVDYVEADTKVHTCAMEDEEDAPYGLGRISHRAPGSTDYIYDSTAGAGVSIYMVDTGIMTEHEEFGGRAVWGNNFANDNDTDESGHGTHTSGTAAGATYGVAKGATLVAVKVLDGSGSGTNSQVISGVEFVATNATSRNGTTRAVMSMSLGGPVSAALDAAVGATIASGVTAVVAAGNDAADASGSSPANLPAAITVGAIDSTDAKPEWSNFGPLVDVFAPGVDVLSAWIGGDDATNTISGTSMSTPHVAGLAAYLIALEGISSPIALSARIRSMATSGDITDPGAGSPNLIAYNGNGA